MSNTDRTARDPKAFVQELRRALARAGLPPDRVNGIQERLQENNVAISVRSLERYLTEGPPEHPKAATRDAMAGLIDLVPERLELAQMLEDLWLRAGDGTANGSSPTKAHSDSDEWYGVIPVQPTRPYASIDRISVNYGDDDVFEGVMERVAPVSENGLRWRVSGVKQGQDALFFSFTPSTKENPLSKGSAALHRQGYLSPHYSGQYTRCGDRSHGDLNLVSRRYEWHRKVPQAQLPYVALIDFDNTLRPGWTIVSWIRYLARQAVGSARTAFGQLSAAIERYEAASITHDELAEIAAELYADAVNGVPFDELRSAVPDFVSNSQSPNFFSYAHALCRGLKDRGIAPVLVSGAPYSVLGHFSQILEVDKFFGLRLEIRDDGTLGGVLRNPGTSEGKGAVVRKLREERGVALAFGDSHSDLPLWRAAPLQLVAGSAVIEELEDWPGEKILRTDPESTTAQEIFAWLDRNGLPDLGLPPMGDFR